jgi:hypothetical protein
MKLATKGDRNMYEVYNEYDVINLYIFIRTYWFYSLRKFGLVFNLRRKI